VEQDKATTSAPPLISVQSDDIQLSIRMPSGNRLEIKVTKQDVLRKVKNFVDENKGNELGSYDLSLVYPKRVFSEQGTESLFLVEIICLEICLYFFFILKFLT
jgi:hypothetical protein